MWSSVVTPDIMGLKLLKASFTHWLGALSVQGGPEPEPRYEQSLNICCFKVTDRKSTQT